MKRLKEKVFKCKWTLMFVFVIACNNLPAQQQKPKSNMPTHFNNKMEVWFSLMDTDAPGWYRFKPGLVKNSHSFIQTHKEIFGLSSSDEIRLEKKEKDPLGNIFYRFQQYYQGIKVDGAQFVIQETGGYATMLHGKWVQGLQINVKPLISVQEAIQAAKNILPDNFYFEDFRHTKKVAREAYMPKGELIIEKKSSGEMFLPQNFKLCYRFQMYPEKFGITDLSIDANTKALFKRNLLEHNCTSTFANTNWYGGKFFKTRYYRPTVDEPYGYYLEQLCPTEDNHWIYVVNGNDQVNNQTYYYSFDNTTWNNTNDQTSAVTSLWGCSRALKFYGSLYNRNGFSNMGDQIRIIQNSLFSNGTSRSNASMFNIGNLADLKVGDNGTNGDNSDDWNALDIMGHEVSHGLTIVESNLKYEGESGAINESFSDIMGTQLEYWDFLTPFDWFIGEDMGGYLRDMSDPKSTNQPDTYGGSFWANTNPNAADNGGVHINSGIMNFWFYLLALGGSGTNDNGTTYTVTGVGITTAAQIIYNANCYVLLEEDQFVDVRSATLLDANNNYGTCSPIHLAVGDAWYAVGVGGFYPQPRIVCGIGPTYPYTVTSTDVMTFAPGCTYTTGNTSPVTPSIYSASKGMTFLPGFTAPSGVNNIFQIIPCNITRYIKTPDSKDTEQSSVTVQPNKEEKLPSAYMSNTPNPFTSTTAITVKLPTGTRIASLQVYSNLGTLIQTIRLDNAPSQTIPFDGSKLSSGIYHAILMCDGKPVETISMLKQ